MRNFDKVIGKLFAFKFLIFLGCFATSQIASAQTEFVSDPNKRMDLLVKFSTLHAELSYDSRSNIDSSDIAVIENAMSSAPYLKDVSSVIATACDYFMNTESDELETEMLAMYLADANQTELDGLQQFLEQSYAALTHDAKQKFDEVTYSTNQISSIQIDERQSYYAKLLGYGDEFLLRRYNKFCGELPKIKERLDAEQFTHEVNVFQVED